MIQAKEQKQAYETPLKKLEHLLTSGHNSNKEKISAQLMYT